MVKKAEQTAINGILREPILEIEEAADKADAKRSLIGGLTTELTALEDDLSDVMHAHEEELDHEEGPKGEKLIVYRRGDYNCSVKAKESVLYKIKARSKGTAREGA